MTLAGKIINFNRELTYTGEKLPPGIRVMNPFREFKQTLGITDRFYTRFYNDNRKRFIILGINPGRYGAGLTGIPFTDPKRLTTEYQIDYIGKATHEPSSVFIHDVIHAYGGANLFYKNFYINSICPLGFTSKDDKGKEKNYNYYDSKKLSDAVHNFIVENIRKQIDLGVHTNICFCLGTGNNEKFLRKLNNEYHFFDKIIALEHPRFVMQYKSSQKQVYIDKYISAFKTAEAI